MDHIAELRQQYPVWRRTSEEETVNAITHGFGFVLSVAGSLVMMSAVLTLQNPQLVIGCGLYLISLMSVYAMSTMSHSPTSFRAKLMFRQLDQAFIYLLIVGTYTPYAIAYLHGWQWNVLMAAMWMVAIAGFVAKVFFAHQVHTVPVTTYIALGWMPIISLPSIYLASPAGVMDAIVAGGGFYTMGTFFLMRDHKYRHFHAAWHLCVIAGSACHFYGIYAYVVHGTM